MIKNPSVGARKKHPRKDETGSERFDRIHGELRDRICMLTYPPGTVLSEVALAKEFGVSRTPIRRVLHKLEYMGLVHIKNGVGTIVTDIDLKTFKETYDLRKRLSELMGELSPVDITKDHIAKIDDLIIRTTKLQKQKGKFKDYATVTKDLQNLLANMTGNNPLREIIELLYYRVARIWFTFLPQLNWNDTITDQLTELNEIRSAMESNDIRGVGQFRSLHLHRMLNRIGRLFIEP